MTPVIFRLNATGSIDSPFGNAGFTILDNTNELVNIDYNPANGNIIYSDHRDASNWKISRVNRSGVQQTTLNNFSDSNIFEFKFYQKAFI